MGDNRAHIEIKMSLYGQQYKTDMSINYNADSSECWGVDPRVTDWFRKAWEDAHVNWEHINMVAPAESIVDK